MSSRNLADPVWAQSVYGDPKRAPYHFWRPKAMGDLYMVASCGSVTNHPKELRVGKPERVCVKCAKKEPQELMRLVE